MKVYTVHDKEFKQYGKIIASPFTDLFLNASNNIEIAQGVSYRAEEASFCTCETKKYYEQYFGDIDVQIGYCWGYNQKLNAFEWHKCSEVAVALTDLIMILGDVREVVDNHYDTANAKAFLIKKGESVEMYGTTLHYCPAGVNGKPFKNLVILPKGTNTPTELKTDDKLLVAKSKWVIIHPDYQVGIDRGWRIGLKGENITIE